MTPSVSVVIPVLNAARTLSACLSGVAALHPPPAEVMLVDNGSTDESLDILRAFSRRAPGLARVLGETRRGAGAARNTGIRAAQGEFIAFTDADCVPEAGWLGHLVTPFVNPMVGAVAGRVVSAPPASTLELFSALYTLRLPAEPGCHRRWTPWEGGFPTANLAVRRALLEHLGGFDESVGNYGEDYDLCARVYKHGDAIEYTPEARVAHHHRTTLQGMLRQAFGFGRSHPYMFRRHAPDGLWVDLPRGNLQWGRCPAHAWVDIASADKKVLALLLAGAAWPPALPLLTGYAAWLAFAAGRRARQAGNPVSPISALALAGLLVLKSSAMTTGRWWGSAKYGALCL